MCTKAEKQYFSSKLNSCHGDGRRTWQVINEAIKRSKSHSKEPSKLITEEGKIIENKSDIANCFNTYFTNIGIELSNAFQTNNDINNYDFKPEKTIDSFQSVSESEVSEYINEIDVNKGPGIDNIHPKLLKLAVKKVSKPLSHIFNLSFACGRIPSILKSSRVIPIYKGSGNPMSPSNYRPISILPVRGKILEKSIHKQIQETLGNDLIYKYQYGFRKGHGTSEAIRDLVDDLYQNINRGCVSIGIFLDFKKAFDTVDHRILIKKLEGYGFKGYARAWLENYLQNRKQVVRVSGTTSSGKCVGVGVPQGSILGPLLFLIYINDMNDCINHGKLRLFADDTNIFYNTADLDRATALIHEDLLRLNLWLDRNRLTLNVKKM